MLLPYATRCLSNHTTTCFQHANIPYASVYLFCSRLLAVNQIVDVRGFMEDLTPHNTDVKNNLEADQARTLSIPRFALGPRWPSRMTARKQLSTF